MLTVSSTTLLLCGAPEPPNVRARRRQGPDLGGVNLGKCYDFSQIRCFARTGADALGSVHCQPTGWMHGRIAHPTSWLATSGPSVAEGVGPQSKVLEQVLAHISVSYLMYSQQTFLYMHIVCVTKYIRGGGGLMRNG